MRPLPPVPLKRSQTLESINSADSDRTISASDRAEVVRMTPKVDVEITFNGQKVSNGQMSRSMSLASLRSLPPGANAVGRAMQNGHASGTGGGAGGPSSEALSRRTSISGLSSISGFTSLMRHAADGDEILDEVQLSMDEIRALRIDNQELRAADHRQKAELCDLKAKVIALNGQLAKCRQLAMVLKNYVK